jgi:hypothetical protein
MTHLWIWKGEKHTFQTALMLVISISILVRKQKAKPMQFLESKDTPIRMPGEQLLSQEGEASWFANDLSHKTASATAPEDTVWQLTRKRLQRRLPVGRLRAAKYLQVVECKSSHGVGVLQ